MNSQSEAQAVLKALEAAGAACMKALKLPPIPLGRRSPWKVPGGPIGLGLHYTGGPDHMRTLRWFNDPAWGNTGSSCHCLVLDRLTEDLAEVWPRQEAASVFPVPTLLIASVESATWNINWANSRVFGIENRNTGYLKPSQIALLGKYGVPWKDRIYEPYTREQVVANILLGRMWRLIRGELFSPFWVVQHSQIWATKSDPGPLFPSPHDLRDAIFGAMPVGSISWLENFPGVDTLTSPRAVEIPSEPPPSDVTAEPRKEPARTEPRWHADTTQPPVRPHDRLDVATALRRLGWPVTVGSADSVLQEAVTCFQRSTLAFKKDNPARVLEIDGVAGPKTISALAKQLQFLRLPKI